MYNLFAPQNKTGVPDCRVGRTRGIIADQKSFCNFKDSSFVWSFTSPNTANMIDRNELTDIVT